MTQKPSTPDAGAPDASFERTATMTRVLLACGVAAAPLFVVVVVVVPQMLFRDGFDPSRHPLSLLSNGDLGWIQITNFVAAGVLFVAGAVGMRRVLLWGWASVLAAHLLTGLPHVTATSVVDVTKVDPPTPRSSA